MLFDFSEDPIVRKYLADKEVLFEPEKHQQPKSKSHVVYELADDGDEGDSARSSILRQSQNCPAERRDNNMKMQFRNPQIREPHDKAIAKDSIGAKKDERNLLENVDPKYGEEILSTIILETEVRLEDIRGNEAAKDALEQSVILPSVNPSLFTGLRAPCKGILLYGPPGNGKTMLAKAVATESKCTFFNISAATIMSKWVGDSERLVQALFRVARNAQPSIIFIDEIDSMLCERQGQEDGSARSVKTEFLVQLDGCASKANDRILVLAATNRPQDLDQGILRRFPQRIFIDLPDAAARAEMIRRTFDAHATEICITSEELGRIAARTENYSYSDLMALCRSTALIPVEALQKDQLKTLSASELRPINFSDFEAALQCVKPSTNEVNRQQLMAFARNH